MNSNKKSLKAPVALVSALSTVLFATSVNAYELTGFALMPANTFAVGPTSGQFITGAGGAPFVNKQPMQGLSGVMQGPVADTFYVMPDNGFGAKSNSADALLRVYAVKPEFKTWDGSQVVGAGAVLPVNYFTGDVLSDFNASSFIGLRDPYHKIGFSLVADQANYPNGANNIPVPGSIKKQRLLTGADLDIESIRKDNRNHLWFGEEFGPFLIETNAKGVVLRAEIRTPNILPTGSTATGTEVVSPSSPYLNGQTPNLGGSRGFEGMAINPKGSKLYTLLEGTVTGDNSIDGSVGKNLRINEFDLRTRNYTNNNWLYRLEANGTNIGDMTAINNHQFVVLERNGGTATSGIPFKKVYLIDIAGIPSGGFVTKTELVDLMNVADPHDLNGDGSTTFTFPFVTIEDILPLDATTLLVINDNNFPFTGGRDFNSDNTEFLKIKLDKPLKLAKFNK